MDNVLVFPKAPIRAVAANESFEEPAGGRPTLLKRIGVIALAAIMRIVFLVMYWLRALVVPLCNFVAGALLIGTVVVVCFFPDKSDMLWSFATVSFVSFVLGWGYDFILMKLSPVPMMDSL